MATAATPTSSPEQAPPALVPRFGRTERALHWVHTVGFLGMLGSGLVLYLPGLSASVGDRPTTKAVHLGVALAWMTALALVSVGGDRRALRRTRREIEHFLDDDLRWLRGKRVPQGRFNAGQKSHTVAQGALAGLFVLSGVLLWLGERSTAFRFPGTVALHDGAMFVATGLLAGHLFLALIWPATRPAMRGIVRGTVRADWARRQHAAWTPATEDAERRAPGRRRVLLCLALLVAGGAATAWVVDDGLAGAGAGPSAAPAAAPPLRPGADVLALDAQAAVREGDLPRAAALLRSAVAAAPEKASLRTSLGFVLAQGGDLAAAEDELALAVKIDPKAPDAHLFLGAVRISAGKVAAGRREVRRYLRLDPRGENVALARRLLRRP